MPSRVLEATVSLLLPKGQKAGKDDASDKSKDRIWAGQSPAYGDDDEFLLSLKRRTKTKVTQNPGQGHGRRRSG